MTPHDTRSRKRALALCLAAMFSLAILRVESKSGSARPAQQTPSKDFGRPVSLETGTERFPQNHGFLQCAREQLGPEFRHSHTDELFDDLAKEPLSGDRAVSVGHGGAGTQCTGKADDCGTDDTIVMDNYNRGVWEPLASKIKGKYHLLTLLGCEIGQGNEGADFLYDMAKTIDAPVRAPDSLIFCNADGIYFDEGGSWVVATPQAKPTPHPPPKPFVVKETRTLRFQIKGVMRTLKPEDVQFLEFQHRSYREKEFRTLAGFGPAILQSVGFGEPFVSQGRPAAIVTGSFLLRLSVEGQQPVKRQFVLYNDVLVEDLEERDVFYRVDRVRLEDYIARLTK